MLDNQVVGKAFKFYWDSVLDDVLVIEFLRTYSWSEYYQLMDEVYTFIDGRVEDVMYINIYYPDVRIPTGNAASHFQEMLSRFRQPYIVAIELTPNSMLRRIVGMLGNFLRLKANFVPNMQAARRLIEEQRQLPVAV